MLARFRKGSPEAAASGEATPTSGKEAPPADSELSDIEAGSEELDLVGCGDDNEANGGDLSDPSEPADVSDGEEDDVSSCGSLRPCIRHCGYVVACLKCFTWPPLLFVYCVVCTAMVGYYLYLNYLVVLLMVAAAYLVLMILVILVTMFMKDMKRFVRRHMRRVLVDLPRNVVIELRRKTKRHYKRAKKGVKKAADNTNEAMKTAKNRVDATVDDVNHRLQGLLAEMSSMSDKASNDVKEQTANLIAMLQKVKMSHQATVEQSSRSSL